MDDTTASDEVSTVQIFTDTINRGPLSQKKAVEIATDTGLNVELSKKRFAENPFQTKGPQTLDRGTVPRLKTMKKVIAGGVGSLGKKLSKGRKHAVIDEKRKIFSAGASTSKTGATDFDCSENIIPTFGRIVESLKLSDSEENAIAKIGSPRISKKNDVRSELFGSRKYKNSAMNTAKDDNSQSEKHEIPEQKTAEHHAIVSSAKNPKAEIVDFDVKSFVEQIISDKLSKLNEKLENVLGLIMQKCDERPEKQETTGIETHQNTCVNKTRSNSRSRPLEKPPWY